MEMTLPSPQYFSLFCETFFKHCRQGSNRGRFVMTKAQEDDIRKWFVLECLKNYSKVRANCELRMRTANPASSNTFCSPLFFLHRM